MSLTHAPDFPRQESRETREQTAAPPLSNTEVIPTIYVHSDTNKLSAPPTRRPTTRLASRRTRFRRRWKRNCLRRSQRREVHRSHATVVTFSLSVTMPILLLIVIIAASVGGALLYY